MRLEVAAPAMNRVARSTWTKALGASIATVAVCVMFVRWLLPPQDSILDGHQPNSRILHGAPLPGGESWIALRAARGDALRDSLSTSLWWHDLSSTVPPTSRLLCSSETATCFAVHPSSGRLFVGCSAGGIGILPFPPQAGRWPVSLPDRIFGHAPQGQPWQMVCTRDGSLLLVRDTAGLAAWHVHPADSFRVKWYRADPTLSRFVLDPTERTVLCGRLVSRHTELVELDAATGEMRRVIATSPASMLIDMALSHHGRLLAAVEDSGRAILFERQAVTDEWRARSMAGLGVRNTRIACFSPRADQLITSDSKKRCFVAWNLRKDLSPREFGFHDSEILGCAFLNDDRLLSWGLGDTIRIWDVNDGTLDQRLSVGR